MRPFNRTLHVYVRLKEYEEALMTNKRVVWRNKEVRLIKWAPPSPGMVKLNVDGAFIKGVAAGCGGIVRDGKRCWLRGFAKNVDICSSYVAEL